MPAYSFTLPAADGRDFVSDEHLPLIVYFYPKDNTPGCTTEGHDFNARLAQFEALGYTVAGSAGSVEHALAKLDTADVDLAVVDVNLAGEPSFPVADALRARGVPFLFTTGYGQQGLPERFADAAVLAKPFRRQDIQDALAGLRPAA